jgi:ABC-type methionine transport system ATPase subunit
MANDETEDTLQSVRLNLTFPVNRVDQPLLAQAIKQFGVIADIRRAQIEPETGGYIMLELTGTDSQIDQSIAFFKSYGVGVGFIGSDEVQAY